MATGNEVEPVDGKATMSQEWHFETDGRRSAGQCSLPRRRLEGDEEDDTGRMAGRTLKERERGVDR